MEINMLDIKFIRNNQEKVREAIKNKNVDLDLDKLLAADERRRHLLSESEALKAEQNKRSKGPQSPVDLEELKALKEKKKLVENELACVEEDFGKLMSQVPNIPSEDTPVGPDESGNKILGQWGKIKNFDFKPKEHWELGESLDLIDSERAAKVSGARFTYLKRGLVLMEFAIIQYGLSVLTDEKLLKKIIKKSGLDIRLTPFIPILPPVFIKPDVFQKMARLEPKEERYHIPTDDLYLIGSAEHTMGSMHMDETFKEEDLPVRYVGFSTAFRREAGAAGKDTRGIIRLHEFHKVEMEVFSSAEQGIEEHKKLIAIQNELLQGLGLPYQVILKCTADIGDPNARGVDINTWMPGQDRFCETHTADYMADYQARRLNTKYRKTDGETAFVHMNDATAIAIGRTIAAIMENYQQPDGSIKIPDVLKPWMMDITEIKRT